MNTMIYDIVYNMICAHPQTVAMTFLCLQRRDGISNEKDESKEGLEECVTCAWH